MIQNLKVKLAQAEASATNFQIDQIAWLIGSFPLQHPMRTSYALGCPRIEALLPEMEPCANSAFALLRVAEYMDRDDIVGYVADTIRKAVR